MWGRIKKMSKRKLLHPLFAFFQLAVHTARPNSLALFRFGVGQSSAWPLKYDRKVSDSRQRRGQSRESVRTLYLQPPDSGGADPYCGGCTSGILGEERTMASLDWSQCPAVESIPGKVSGAWVFRDTRMPVSIVFENLEAGASIDEIMEWFDVTREQVVTVLQFAARSLDAPPNLQQPGQAVDEYSL